MSTSEHTNLTKPKLLIVDDNPQNIYLLLEILKSQYKITVAKDGRKALNLATKEPQPDLILLDVMMPNMDGYEVCQELKSSSITCDIPVIFISALNEVLDKVKAFSAGGVDFIMKPFQPEEVVIRIRTHIELFLLRQKLRSQTVQLSIKNDQLQQVNQILQTQYQQAKETHLRLIQTEKMASLGELVAGIAHEINNPLGFICNNLKMAHQQVFEMLEAVEIYKRSGQNLSSESHERLEELDLEFLADDLPELIVSMEKGVETISGITKALRIFSRADNTEQKKSFDVHAGLDSALMILRYQLKANENRPDIKVFKDYGKLPKIACYPGKLNQVFMNVLANAVDAFEEKNTGLSYKEIGANPNQITIRTFLLKDQMVQVDIEDNGPGIPETVQGQIFEQGFTTKEAGKGTGLGMAIAQQIIETDHGGSIKLQSSIGQGSTFTILIPVAA